MAKIKLSLDLDAIRPGEPFKVGTQTIIIRPLTFGQYSDLIKKFSLFLTELEQKQITFDNWQQQGNLVAIADSLLTDFPAIIEEASGIELESLNELPLEVILEMLVVIVDVNSKAKESLLGNSRSLSTKILNLFSQTKTETEPKKTASRKTKK